MQNIQNLVSCVLENQGSRKREGEWPNKSGCQYQASLLLHSAVSPSYTFYWPLFGVFAPCSLLLYSDTPPPHPPSF